MSGVSKRKFLYFKLYINNLGNINSRLDTSLSSSVLDYALTLPEGLHTVRFPGDSYTGADTPNSYYRYSGATIIVRSKGKVVTVLLYGISTKAPLAVNSYDGGKWKGWDQYVTKDDLLSIDVKKYASGALSKGSQKEINLTFEPRTGYTRRYFVGELTGTGSNSSLVNVHGSTLSFFAFDRDANITATILCIYTKD